MITMTRNNPLIEKLDEVSKRTACDENVMITVFKHLQVAKKYVFVEEPDFNKNEEEYNKALLAKIFITYLDTIYPKERFTCKLDENFDWSIPLYPSEVFRKKDDSSLRLSDFFKLLKVADILDCKVTDIGPANYSLKVLHKHGSTRLLEDLNIIVSLPKSRRIEESKLDKMDYVRVAVSGMDHTTQVIKVTLDKIVFQMPDHEAKLGKIKEEDLPLYVRNPSLVSMYSTMTEYLQSQKAFESPKGFLEMVTAFGLNPNKHFTILRHLDRLNDEVYLQEFKKVCKVVEEKVKRETVEDIQRNCVRALSFLNQSSFSEALQEINKALELDPNCIQALEIRSKIYSKSSGDLANMDDIKAYILDNQNLEACERLSKVYWCIARKAYEISEFIECRNAAKMSLKFKPNNKHTLNLLKRLKKHHPELYITDEPEQKEENITIKIKQEPL